MRPLLEGPPPGPRRHWLESADGVRLHLLEHRAAPGPAALLLPGFHRRAETTTHVAMGHRLASRMACYALDFRGHGRSQGRYTFGLREEADVEAALAFLRGRGHEQVLVVALSMGAYMALRTLGSRPGAWPEVKALVAISAPARWSRVYPRADPRIPLQVRRPYGEAAWLPRIVYRAVFGTRPEAADLVAALPCPLQLHHHEADWLIRFRHGAELFAAAREPKELHVYGQDGRMDHADALVRRRFEEVMGRIEGFFERHGAPG